MGGIMAIRRGEAHPAGCHLLDSETGEYNTAFIKKYFPETYKVFRKILEVIK